MNRKPAIKNLRDRLNHLYKINTEYEKAVKKTFDLSKEQVEDTLSGENVEEQKDLKLILQVVGEQRGLLLKNYLYELKRLYRYLDKITNDQEKLILILRHVHFLSWRQIAVCVGEGLTAKDVRKIYEQFIIENA